MNSLISVVILLILLFVINKLDFKSSNLNKIYILITFLFVIYQSYQIVRILKIGKIKDTFSVELNQKYSFYDMYNGNSKNWYSFKYPSEEDYKN